MNLEIHVTFIGGKFHGDEWEWPPAPARLFQALIAATHHGAHGLIHQSVRDAALRWLEKLPPPLIVCCGAVYGSDHVENYVPSNDDGLGEDAHIRSATKPIAAHALLGDGSVTFRWTFDDSSHARKYADVIVAMASLVTRLGRTTDSVFARGRLLSQAQTDVDRLIFTAREGGHGRWCVPAPGFFDLCTTRFPRSVSALPPDYTNSRYVEYSRTGSEIKDIVSAPPIAIFEMLRTDGESWLAFDPRDLRQPAGMVRHAMIQWAARSRQVESYFGADRLARFVHGHKVAGSSERSEGGHFAVIPLPSMNREGTADGWIRRVAILGYGIDIREDGELFDELVHGLQGSALDDNGRSIGELRRLTGDAASRQLFLWKQGGARWRSVTPVILTGHYRRGRSLGKCLLRTLSQQGFDLGKIESVATYSGPIVPKTLPARAYRVQGYLETTPRVHAEVIFRQPQRGVLVIGRGRFSGFGLGLFVPIQKTT